MGPYPNDRIGNYRVEAELGPSGAGLLIQAQHIVLPRRVIIKVVHPAFAHAQPYVLQTLREACILEAIAHPGVPVVYESGVLRDRRPWFALEVINGPTLDDLLVPGALPVIDVAGLVRDLADLLEHAHRRGVIHRGLRPDRIVITADRRYPLCIPDWSEAIAHDATSHLPASPSESGQFYLAPEMAGGELDLAVPPFNNPAVDDRVDMFALGAIAYRALTGVLPFDQPADGDERRSDRDGLYVRAGERRPDAPAELCAIIDSLLSFDRFDRPSASEVRADLDWLFETLPSLTVRSQRRESPQISQVQRHTAVQKDLRRGNVALDVRTQRDLARIIEQPRLRRPRWTPDVHHLESRIEQTKSSLPGTHSIEDDRTKD